MKQLKNNNRYLDDSLIWPIIKNVDPKERMTKSFTQVILFVRKMKDYLCMYIMHLDLKNGALKEWTPQLMA